MKITEGVIEKMHPHFIKFLGFYFMGIIFIILGYLFFWQAIAFGILVFFLGEVIRRAETFYVLESGVAREYKLLSTSRQFVEYKKIQNLAVDQSFLENMLGIGSVAFDTSGSDTIEVTFSAVKRPYAIEKIVREKMA